jgi:hypothetical protein
MKLTIAAYVGPVGSGSRSIVVWSGRLSYLRVLMVHGTCDHMTAGAACHGA